MGVDIRLFAAILFVAKTTFAQEDICSYMIAIPREPKPDDFPAVIEEGTWSERPLFPGPEREELCMSSYIPGSGSQTIYMEEEIDGDVIIAKINYNGDVEPHINRDFLSGTSALLGVVTRRIDGSWYLVVTQKQDYESPGMQLYVFYLSVDGQSLALITSVIIVNIDDNRPMVQVFDACTITELGEARLSECVYEVSDADGRISTSAMTFEIESDRNDDEIFYIEGTNWPNDWFHMSMTVGIRTPLNFEENALHIFSVTALDSLPNTHTVTMMVQVENVEHRPPRWVEIFAVQQFDEKTAVDFRVRAIDGDTGINRPIHYRIETEEEDDGIFYIETSPGGREGATLFVNPIDRDALEREVFRLSIIAYKLDDAGQESYSTEAPVVIIVNDINDQRPEPFHEEYHIEIEEETAMTLNLQEFGFHDRDLGQNAQYEVFLESISPPGAHEAFYIAPLVGYQRQTFIIGTTQHNMLDYEVPDFQNIVLKVRAVDMNNTDLVGEARLFINLINWNDELPIFDEETTTVTFNETEGTGFLVGNVRASDRDIDDRVVHSLMGNVATDYLRIDEDTGDIFVTADDAFDYHRQNVIFVQVRADDTLGEPLIVNTAVTQLVIQLLDINNTPPTLRLPRGTFSTDENVPEGHLITHEIVATDPDTTALLEFEINWDGSYATKQGRATDENEYRGCVEIITEYPDENSKGDARGRIKVKEIRHNITIDFEMFEVLYLSIRVYDRMTYIGDEYDESMFTITIVDLNDNPPVWENGTLEQQFSVREMSANGTVIGSVLATDIDGPQYNQVRYTIFPREDTPPDLVTIHFYTGQITVNASNAIDADVPKRWHLYYTVIASDKCYVDPIDCPPDPHYHDTEGEITINIIDTNNKLPQPDYDDERFKLTVELLENATNLEFVSYVVGKDLDRDELYHQVGYLMNYAMNPRLLQFFAVEQDTGLIHVNYPEGSTEVLDRDGTEPTHELYFNLYDNFHRDGDGFRNQYDDEVRITVVLLDVNDNAPELPDPSTISWSVSENYAAGTSFLPILHAPDLDEPNTPNSLVGFIVEFLIPHRDIEEKQLIDIRSIDTDKGEFFTIADLRGYWGTYDMHIWAFDHGDPQQHSREVYELVIRPWNYHEPVFVFPLQDTVIRLSREQALVSNFLQTTDGNFLQQVHATDEDGGEAGQVTFQVVGDDEAMEIFDVSNGPDNYGTLNLRRYDFTDVMIKEFQVTIEATDGGTEPESLSSRTTFRAVFIPTTGEPIFEINTATVAFIELEDGLTERHELPLAKDLKNHLCVDHCYDIYYKITDGNSEGYFGLDPRDNIIYLTRELDRSISESHTLTVAASNSMESTTALMGSTLTVTVNVREANPRPIFMREIYTAGISTLDVINRELLTVQATHTEDLPITYAIDMDSMAADPSLHAVQDQAFTLDPQTGVLTLNIQPSSSMHGMFDFNVVATDSDGGSDITKVRVYLISTQNRVTFRFVNTLEKVENSRDFIAQTFSAGFGMTCNIDQVVQAADALGLAVGNLTEVRSHFIRDDAPVPADEIEQLRSDTVLLREIQTTLNTELLVLDDFFTDISPEVGTDSTQITIYVLAGLAALLGFMFVVLLVTYIIRTRILSRRLEALSITKYGSVDSGLNRAGLAAPGTNKHAAEGSNPIWNESFKAPDFDAISEVSYDSDLIGIEDLPQFRNDYFPRESDLSQGNFSNEELVSTHKNNFGFSTPSFAPEFARNQFRND